MNRFRYEEKYLLNAEQEALLRLRAAAVMKPDPHTRTDGSYLIRSVYFDDVENSCLQENIDGTDPRRKYRIRYYNRDPERIVLERKSKRRGLCLKEGCRLSRKECEQLLRGEVPAFREEDETVKKKMFMEIRLAGLRPVNIVTYERIPFVYSGGNVRITFDRKLTDSQDVKRFLTGDYIQRPVLIPGQSLMEVKWDEMLSGHIRKALQTERLQRTAFSKYAVCRMTGM